MAKKGTKKKAAKPATKNTIITFGCVSKTCVADTGPKTKVGDTGSKVTLKANSETVTIQFFDPNSGAPLRPPFTQTTGTGPIVIHKSGPPPRFTVRDDALHHNRYKATCEKPDCVGLHEPPEMIVP